MCSQNQFMNAQKKKILVSINILSKEGTMLLLFSDQ